MDVFFTKEVTLIERDILQSISKNEAPPPISLLLPISLKGSIAIFDRWHSDVWTACTRACISLPAGSCARMLHDGASALRYLHLSGWCHCDIKPSNILCNSSFSSFCVCDLGAAVAHGGMVQQYSPRFCGPCAASSGVADPRDDMISLALSVVACATLSKPKWTHSHPPTETCRAVRILGGRIVFFCSRRGACSFPWPPIAWTRSQELVFAKRLNRMGIC